MGDYQAYARRLNAPQWVVPGNHDIGNKPMPDKPSHLSEERIAEWEQVFGPSFYEAQVVPGVRLIAVNSSLMGMGLERDPEQWAFLEEHLATPSDPFTIVMTHYPPFVNDVDEADAYFNLEPESRKRLLALLNQGGVNLLVAGHTHHPRVNKHGGIPHVIAPAISFGLPRDRQPEGWTLVTIHPDGSVKSEDRLLEDAAVDET